MARNRTPLAKAKVSGADVNHPGRFKGRKAPKTTRPVGQPYAGMSEAEVRYWNELTAELPWLNSGHRVLLRVACRLAAGMDSDEFGVSKAQALSSVLSKLGATPVDETKVAHGDEDEEDGGFDFGRPN